MVSALALVIRAATDLQLTHHHPSSSSAAAHAHPRWGARRPATLAYKAMSFVQRWCIMLKEGDQAAMKGWGDLLMAKLQQLKPCCLPASV
uniref:Uncharacterized protein n=1 Tax=Oryza nivara TaxID=4536 RepID=A0A0E0IJF2_ORYNI